MERNIQATEYRGIAGEQTELVWDTVPATALQSLIGQNVRGSVLTVAGTYTAKFATNGLSAAIEVHITATLVTQTATTDVFSTFNDETTKKTSYTGVGALVTATRQTSTYAPKGERRGIASIVVAGAGSVTFTQAEYNGV